MFQNVTDNQNTDNSHLNRTVAGPSRMMFGVGSGNDENQRIQQAVNRYNGNVFPPFYRRPSTTYKCSLMNNVKPIGADHLSNNVLSKVKDVYRNVGDFPSVILSKTPIRPLKRESILAQLRASSGGLPLNRFLDDTNEKYADIKCTRSALDVLQDLSRKRIRGREDGDEAAKRRCKGLGGDIVQNGEIAFKPLFVPKPRNFIVVRRDQMTQTLVDENSRGDSTASTVSQDPKSELRKKLAQRNNAIFASLSSSSPQFCPLFFKRKRVAETSKEPDSAPYDLAAKRQKTTAPSPRTEPVPSPETRQERTPSRREQTGPKSPPTKDKLMSIYHHLGTSKELKQNVLSSAKDTPCEVQFKRSGPSKDDVDVGMITSISTISTPSAPSASPTISATLTEMSTLTNLMKPTTSLPSTPIMSTSIQSTSSTPTLNPTLASSGIETTPSTVQATTDSTPKSGFSFGFLQKPAIDSKTSPFNTGGTSELVPPSFLLAATPETPRKSPPTKTPSFTPVATKTGGLESPKLQPEPFKFGLGTSTEDKSAAGAQTFSPSAAGAQTFSPSAAGTRTFSPSAAFGVPKTTAEASLNFSFKPSTNVSPSSTGGIKAVNPDASFDVIGSKQSSDPSENSEIKQFTFSTSTKEDSQKQSPKMNTGFGQAPGPFGVGQIKSDGTSSSTSSGELKSTVDPGGFKINPSPSSNAPFSFGTPKDGSDTAKTTIGHPTGSSLGGFNFGAGNLSSQTTSSSTAAPSPTFSFGKPASSSETTKPSSTFSFGAKTTAADAATTTASLFSFGGKTTPVSSDPDKKSVPSSAFSFGNAKSSNAEPISASAPFSFGGNTSTAVGSDTKSALPSTFTFGGAKPTASETSLSETPFSFGGAPASSVSGGTPAFGNTTAATASSTAEPTATSTTANAFSFGNKPVTSTTEAAKSVFARLGSPPKKPTTGNSSEKRTHLFTAEFNFTASKQGGVVLGDSPAFTIKQTSNNEAFTFGKSSAFPSQSTAGLPTTSSTTVSSTTSSAFTFGQSSAQGPVSTSNTPSNNSLFSFGPAKTTTPPSGFAFGATAAPGSKPFAFGAAATTTTSATVSAVGATTTTTAPAFGSFGSTPGFSAPSVFGTSSTSTVSPFASGTASTGFGASAFGSASAPAFGATTTPSPAFGAIATPSQAFGTATTTPSQAFGSTSTPTFGATAPAPSVFGSNTSAPTFGGTPSALPAFGTPTAAPANGASLFGTAAATTASSAFSTNFGATNTTSAFSGFGAPATTTATGFGSFTSPTPAFGVATTTASSGFGAPASTPAFGTANTAPAFGSNTPAFGSSGFGGSNVAPAFGTPSAPAFGNPTNPPAFGTSNPSFGNTAPAFGSPANSTTSPSFGNAAASTPFQFGASNSQQPSSTGFNFSASAAAAPTQQPSFNFGSSSSGSGSSVFNFGANSNNNSGGAFNFGANTSGFGAAPAPGSGFSAPGTFSIGAPARARAVSSRRRRP